MDDLGSGMSQRPSSSKDQPNINMEELEKLKKVLELSQKTVQNLLDDVDKQISIVKLSDNVEKLDGQMSTLSSEVDSINTRTKSMESMLEKLVQNSNKILKNQSSLEATVNKSNSDVETIKQHIEMFDSNSFQDNYSRLETAVIESTSQVQEIKQILKTKSISDEADLRKLMETQNQKIEEHKSEVVAAINKISQNVETTKVSEAVHCVIKQLQEKSALPPNVPTDSVPAPEVVVPSTAVLSVENKPNSKPDENAGQQQGSGEQSKSKTTPLAITTETVLEAIQPTPPIEAELAGKPEVSKSGLKRLRSSSIKTEILDKRSASSTSDPINSVPAPEAVGPSIAVSPVGIVTISTSHLSEGQPQDSGEQSAGETIPLAITTDTVSQVSQPTPPIEENSIVVKPVVVKGKTEQTKSAVKRQLSPMQNDQTLSKLIKRDYSDDRYSPVFSQGDFEYPLDAQLEAQMSIEPEESPRATQAIPSNIPSSSSTTLKETEAIVADKEVGDQPKEDSSDSSDELHFVQPGNEYDQFEDQHDELDAMPKDDDAVQQEEQVNETENDQDPEEVSDEDSVPLKTRKNKKKRRARFTVPKRASKKVVEVFDMNKHNFEWEIVRNNEAIEYQEDDGTNKTDVFVGKPAGFWKKSDEVMKKLVEQSAAYTANGMVRFACEEPKCTFANEKQRENVSAFLNSHTSAIDPCYLRTTVDPDTYNAIDSDDFRYCQEYLRLHNLQQEAALPMRKKKKRAATGKEFPQLPTIAINHQPFNITSAEVVALSDESDGDYNLIYTPMEIQNLEPNRALVAAEQELFKKDIPEAASEKNRLPAIHVEIKTKEDLHSPNLKKVLDSSPISVLSGVGKALGIDLETLTSERLAATVPNLIVEVMLQVAQPVHQNITLEGKKEWGVQRKYCNMTLAQFDKWKRNEQKAARKLLSLLKTCDPKHAPAMVQDFMKKRIKAPYSFEGEEKEYSWTPFATNIDLTKDANQTAIAHERQEWTINHQSFTLNSADVAALAMESHGKFDQIYTPMKIQKLEPNRELVAAEQEQFKKDIPELASKRHRLPAIHVEIKTKEDLHSPNLKKMLDSSPISVLSGVGKALGINLKTLTSERLAATVPNLIVDVMLQVAQPVHQNITIYGMKEWETQRKYCSMTSAQFEKWKRNEQKAARKLLSLLKTCDPKHAPAMVQDFMKKRIKAPYSFEGEEKEYSWTLFATNIDLTKNADNSRNLKKNQDYFKAQKDILDQLPSFMQATDRGNLLAHIHEDVFGVNTVQMYSKFIGSWTAAHMENSLMASINWNVGPASCIWYAIPYEYWTQLEKLVKEKGQKYHHQNYWPSEEDIKKAGIPLIKFEQREDELVYVNTGTFHWVQAEGYCTNVSWNVGPAKFNQLAISLISAAHDTASKYQCHIPITNVIWNAAEEKLFMDEPLMYSCMRWHMQRSIAWCIRCIAWIESNHYELEDWTEQTDEYIYRCYKCKQEIFNICKVLRTENDQSKDIITCSKCSKRFPGNDERHLFAIYKNIETLSKIYDNFVREAPEEGIQQDQ